ncbi:MAG: V-type ATPase subunit, partial [Lachnospiraceae bacterium]|nr:V-type ATPase subunit [Lachnospiraceae bacterium]
MSKIKDTDYLFLSAKVRTMERSLLNKDRMEQMLEAHSDLDAIRVLAECGYPEITEVTADSLNEMLSAERDKVFKEISGIIPDPEIMNVFKIKYDYHNAKVILKAEALGLDADRLFMDIGRVPAQEMKETIRSSEFLSLPPILKKAVIEAREVLGTTRDPRLA